MTGKRMSEERWNELRKFDVGDPTTWPAVEISESELIAEIDALRRERDEAREALKEARGYVQRDTQTLQRASMLRRIDAALKPTQAPER